MRAIFVWGSCLALAAIGSLSWAGAPSLSDREAALLLEREWNQTEALKIPIGRLAVVTSSWDWKRGTISTTNFEWVQAAERAGIVSVERDQAFEQHKAGKGFSLDNFRQQSQGGVVAKVVVELKPGASIKGQESNHLLVSSGKFSNFRIVSNDPKQCGVDECRLIMTAYEATWTPIISHHGDIAKARYERKRKAAALFRWDAFDSKWKQERVAVGNASDELDTSAIAKFLASGR